MTASAPLAGPPPAPATASWRRAARAAVAAIANRLDPPIVILAYHRITRLDRDPQQLAVSPERFAQQLERLRRRHPVVRFDAEWRSAPRPAAVITFDDGYADNLHEALPVLERLEVPATFFVTTGAIESGHEFWWDTLERVLLGPQPLPARLEIGVGAAREARPTATAAERAAAYQALHPALKRMAPETRDAWLAELCAWSGESPRPRPSHRPLTIDELPTLAAHPLVTVGAHTVTHTALAMLPPARQREELVGARATLERWLGCPVTVASFPFGGRDDFTAESVRLTREAGYARNAANLPRCAHRWSDPLRLPRHLVRDWDGEEFERRLAEFLRS